MIFQNYAICFVSKLVMSYICIGIFLAFYLFQFITDVWLAYLYLLWYIWHPLSKKGPS